MNLLVLKVIIHPQKMNKFSVVNRLGCWIQSSVTKLLHLILKLFIRKTPQYLIKTCEKASPSSIKICVMTSLSIWPVFSGSRVRKAARRSSWAAGRNFCWRMILSGHGSTNENENTLLNPTGESIQVKTKVR